MKNLLRFSVLGCQIFVLLWFGQSVGAESNRYGTFELKNDVTVQVPEGAKKVRVWSALPQEDPAQEIKDLKIEASFPYRIELDSEGSKVLFVEADAPKQKEFKIVTTFVVKRLEVHSGVDAKKAKPISEADRLRLAHYLQPNKHVIIDGDIRKMALEITGNEQNPVLAARKLYDWLLENVEYWVKDPKNKKASPVGSTTYCLTSRTGNCTDFQSLWTSFAQSIGIPTQIVYDSFLKPELMGEDQDQGYHCWAGFYAPGLGGYRMT